MRRRIDGSGGNKNNRYKLGMPIFIVVIMVLSVLGYSIGNLSNTNDSEFIYNGYSFELDASDEQNPVWRVSKEDSAEQDYDFHFKPEEVSDVLIEGKVNYPRYYLVDHPEANISTSDLQLISLAKFETKSSLEAAGKIINIGFLTNSSGTQVTCENASEGSAVVIFNINNITQVKNENNCISISGFDGREAVRAKEMFLFRLLGIA